MATMCYLNFPAIEIKTATDSILYAVSKFVSGKFPQRVIKQTFVDLQDKMRDIYKNALTSYSGKLSENNNYQEMLKVPRPHMFVGYTFDSSFDSTETGLGETQPYMFPNAFFLQEKMTSSIPVLYDKHRNIQIRTNNLRIRVTAEFVITCANREEQFTIYNYILNTLKMYYTMPLKGIQASYILPDYLVTFIKDALYGGEDIPIEDVDADFAQYMKENSAGTIYPVFKNNKKTDSYYEMKYYYNRIDFRLTSKPQMDEGQKTNEAADNFLIRFPAEVQFYVPTNYTVKLPELVSNGVGGTFQVPDFIKLDAVNTDNLEEHVLGVIKKYEKDLFQEPSLYEKGWDFISRQEFTIMNPEDYFNLRDIMPENLLKVFNYLTQEERKQYFRIYIYENRRILDDNKYCEIDDDWNVFIHDGDTLKVHEVEIYIRGNDIERTIAKRKSKQEKQKKLAAKAEDAAENINRKRCSSANVTRG